MSDELNKEDVKNEVETNTEPEKPESEVKESEIEKTNEDSKSEKMNDKIEKTDESEESEESEEAKENKENNVSKDRSDRNYRKPSGGRFDKRRFFYTKKVCKFCTRQLDEKNINYRNVDMLKRFVMPSGKIVPRRISGNCAKHQRRISNAIKRSRTIAFLPFLDR